MSYETKVTDYGIAVLTNSLADGTPVELTEFAVGDGNGNPTVPDEAQTALIREVFRSNINAINEVDSSRVSIECLIPFDQGGWAIREVGIFDAEGGLFAVANFPETYKPTPSEDSTRDLIIQILVDVSSASNVTLNVDPALVVASRDWVAANYNIAALIPGGTVNQLLAKESNSDGDFQWVDAETTQAILDVIAEEQTLADGQDVVTLATATTENCAFYRNGIRLHPADLTVNSSTQITLTSPGTAAGEKLLAVQNDPTTGNAFLSKNQNLADVPDKAAARSNLDVLQASQNLDDLPDKNAARSNLDVLQGSQNFADVPDKAAARANLLLETKNEILNTIFPVYSLYITGRDGNPENILGIGTWQRTGEGRTLVGYKPAAEGIEGYGTLGGTGGSETAEADTEISTEGWGALQRADRNTLGGFDGDGNWIGSGSKTKTGKLVTGSGVSENAEHFESLAHADNPQTFSSAPFSVEQPYIAFAIWQRIA